MANRRYIDFPIASTSGDTDIILIWQDGLNKQTTKATLLSGLPEDLADLNDVVISGLTNGQILRYNSTTGVWENTDQGNLDLNDLNDVTIVSPSNGQVLVYNSSTSQWENSSGGYVPYVGAVTTVDLGAQQLKAGHTTLTTNGSTETLTINHTSGSGKAINVTKGGNNEGLYINKTSGSGNAATIVGTLEATTLKKTGGTSSQFLKADGSVDSTSYGTGTVTSVGLSSATSGVTIGSTPVTTSGTITLAIATASGSQNGLLSSTDWTTFNNKQNALTNPVTGTGTTNYLPKFTGTSTIGNSNLINDASGNLGLGVTPSAWYTGYTALQIGESAALFSNKTSADTRTTQLANNAYLNSGATNWIYAQTDEATRYGQVGGEHQWFNAPSGTAGNAISFTQAMTLSSSGNLGIGTPSPSKRLHLYASNDAASVRLTNTAAAKVWDLTPALPGIANSGFSIYNVTDNSTPFHITDGGNLILTTGTVSDNGARLQVSGTATFSSSVTANGNSNTFGNASLSGRAVIIQAGSTNQAIMFKNSAGGDGTLYINGTSNTVDYNFNTYSVGDALVIKNNGSVGIGTPSPVVRLQVETSTNGNIAYFRRAGTRNFALAITASEANNTIGLDGDWGTAVTPDMTFSMGTVERMRITSGGALQVKSGDVGEAMSVYTNISSTNWAFTIGGSANINGIGTGSSSAATIMRMNRDSGSLRSLNAAGSINASGADYAEYMYKATDDIILKGDVCGINQNGELTNIFADSISFVVKSTNPSYVGNDIWGSNTDDKDELEIQRQKVDRIAFSGQVPCNVLGASVGDYIIPIKDKEGKISGQAVTKPTLEQYQISVGKVWKIMEDGRAWIAVKIG